MSILKLQDLSLSSDPSSRSDRKRRLDMPGGGNNSSTASSGSEITIPAAPANKLGKSTSSLLLIELSPHRSTPLRPIQQRKKLCGDGCARRKAHQCSVIISDATSDAPVTVCKLNCELGDIIQYQYPSIPSTRTRNSPLNTGRNCLDMSIKDISRSGITCLELMYKGVYSHIFLGYDNTTHRYVAVKLTNKGDHFCKRPLRNINPCYEHPHNTEEINHLKQLTHPNIIQFFKGMETNSEKKAIILEYCSNGPITRILEKTRTMSEQVSLKYFKQMFEAVKFIHHKGFAVRNIALQHFLIDDSNQVKMVDLSQLVALDDMRSDLYGIAGFQAPEVLNCRHASHHPSKVDLWSLGACLYTMVTGVRTTIHHSLGKSYKQSFSFPPAVIVGCSIKELLIGLLEYLPNHRFTLNRVEFSDWFRQPTDIVSISGFHLLSKSRKLKLGLNEFMMREYMEV